MSIIEHCFAAFNQPQKYPGIIQCLPFLVFIFHMQQKETDMILGCLTLSTTFFTAAVKLVRIFLLFWS